MSDQERSWQYFPPPGMRGPRRSFGAVLATIVVAAIFQMSAPDDSDLARWVGIVLQAIVVLMSLRAAGAQRRVFRPVAAVMVLVTVASAITLLGPGDIGPAVSRITTLFLILLAPPAILAGLVRELREDKNVTLHTVSAGLCLYMLIGMGFAFLFGALGDLGKPFFADGVAGSPPNLLYYSLTTLTTTGYGDFVAGTELGRALSVTEALIGQIYLVTVVAVLVSNLGMRRVRQ